MPRKRKIKRDCTLEESLEIINKYIGKYGDLLQFKNHKKYNKLENTFRFTMSALSITFLTKLGRDKQVASVHFIPAMPPPGSGMDATSLRYKIYVEYHRKDE